MFLRFFLPIIQLVQSTKFNNHAFKLSFVAIGHLVKIDAVYTNLLALALVYTCVEMVQTSKGWFAFSRLARPTSVACYVPVSLIVGPVSYQVKARHSATVQ